MRESSQNNTGKFTKNQITGKIRSTFKRKDEKAINKTNFNIFENLLDGIEKGDIVATRSMDSKEQNLEQ